MIKTIIGIDIGSSKIVMVVGQMEDDGSNLKIITLGSGRSEGITKGVVNNIEKASRAVKHVYSQMAEFINGQPCDVFVNVSGDHIRALNSEGLETLKFYREVNERDVERAIDRAKGIALPESRVILDYIPQYFSLDDNIQVKDPIGMTGVRLNTLVHVITAERTALQNIYKVLEFLPFPINPPVINSLASAYAILVEDEKELGVALVDIGGGTTDISIFIEGSLRQTMVISLGGNHLTKDIAIGIKTSFEEAEKIKIQHGLCINLEGIENNEVSVSGLGDQQERVVIQKTLVEIIEPRLREIFMMIAAELERHRLLKRLGAGLVFTGGSSLIMGTTDFAKIFFQNLPVRTGKPSLLDNFKSSEDNPSKYSTAIGLLHYASLQNNLNVTNKTNKKRKRNKSEREDFFSHLLKWLKNLI